jgi:hypothetical protein
MWLCRAIPPRRSLTIQNKEEESFVGDSDGGDTPPPLLPHLPPQMPDMA